jgi:hypothetical protein
LGASGPARRLHSARPPLLRRASWASSAALHRPPPRPYPKTPPLAGEQGKRVAGGVSHEPRNSAFRALDDDGDGVISFPEFRLVVLLLSIPESDIKARPGAREKRACARRGRAAGWAGVGWGAQAGVQVGVHQAGV